MTILEVDQGRTSTNRPEKSNLMTMYKTLYTRDDVNRLYVRSKEVGKVLARTGNSVHAEIQRLEDYIKRQRRLQPPETIQTI